MMLRPLAAAARSAAQRLVDPRLVARRAPGLQPRDLLGLDFGARATRIDALAGGQRRGLGVGEAR